MKKLLLSALLIGSLSVSGYANLLSNGSFEGGTGIADVPSWINWGSSGALDATAHDGTQSIKTWFNDTGWYQDFSATAGEEFDASLYAYTASGDKYGWDAENLTYFHFKLEWFDGGSKLSEDGSSTFTPDNAADTWTELTLNATAPANTDSGRFTVTMEGAGAGAGSVLFDSASVTAVPEPVSAGLLGLGLAFIYMLRKKISK